MQVLLFLFSWGYVDNCSLTAALVRNCQERVQDFVLKGHKIGILPRPVGRCFGAIVFQSCFAFCELFWLLLSNFSLLYRRLLLLFCLLACRVMLM